jgi:hypothetical protein
LPDPFRGRDYWRRVRWPILRSVFGGMLLLDRTPTTGLTHLYKFYPLTLPFLIVDATAGLTIVIRFRVILDVESIGLFFGLFSSSFWWFVTSLLPSRLIFTSKFVNILLGSFCARSLHSSYYIQL